MLYLEVESLLTRTPPNPTGPAGFQAFLPIARRGASVDGRAFITPSSGHRSRPSCSLYEYDVSSASYTTWRVAWLHCHGSRQLGGTRPVGVSKPTCGD